MMKKGVSIKVSTLVSQVLIPVILFLIIAGYLFVANFRQLYQDEKTIMERASREVRDALQIELQKSFTLVGTIAKNPMSAVMVTEMNAVPGGLDNDDYRDLESFAKYRRYLEASAEDTAADLIYIAGLDSTGIILSRDIQIGAGFDVRGRDYYKGALANPGVPYVSNPRVSAEKSATPILTITAAVAVTDDSGRPVGIVAMNYKLNRIIDIVVENMELMAENNTRISLYSRRDRGNMFEIWSPGDKQTMDAGGRFFDPEKPLQLEEMGKTLGYSDAGLESLIDSIRTEDSIYFEGETRGETTMVRTQHIPGADWVLLVDMAQSVIYREVAGKLLPPIILFAVIFILVQLLGFFMSLFLTIRPLVNVGSELDRLAEADADLTVQINVKRADEIGKVGLSFNAFVGKLRGLIGGVKSAVDRTDEVKNSITASTEETSTAIEQISANLESINGQIDDLDGNIGTTATSIEQITSNIESIDSQINEQAVMIEESTAAITEMIASLENVAKVTAAKKEATGALSDVAEEGKTRIDETSHRFKDVVSRIGDIQEMADAINNIANQTNLLSMNAAIEAAHAGDAGRGFAVVAEEIRKLAETSSTSSGRITQLIKDITDSVQNTHENVEMTSQAFESIAREVTDTVNAFNEIGQSVEELNTGGRQVLEATEQINAVTANIRTGSSEIKNGTRAMLDTSAKIKDVSSRVTSGMAESLSGTQEIVKAGQMMVELSQSLQSIVGELKEKFGAFKTE